MKRITTARALPLFLTPLALAAGVQAQGATPLLQEGDSIAGVGLVTRIDNLAVNDDGSWIVEADTDNANGDADGVLIKNGVLYLREDDAIAPSGARLDSFDSVNLNASGHSGWNFFLDGTTGIGDDSGLYYDTNLLIQEGTMSTAPQFSPNTPYIGFFDAKLNGSNTMLVVASIDDPAIASTVDRALVLLTLDASGALVSESVLAKEGDFLPGQNDPVADFGTGPHSSAINALGDVLYEVDTAGVTLIDGAVYLNDTLLAQEGSPSPLAGRNWSSLQSSELGLNDHRDWVLSGYLDGDTATNAVIVRNGAEFRQEGTSFPAISPFVLTTFGTGPVLIANSGEVLWFGDWDDPDTTVDSGLFIDDTLLVQEGVTAIGGVIVDTLAGVTDGYAISPNGRYVVFEATLVDGTNGAYLIDRGVRATTVLRNGAGGNPMVYTSTSRPILGSTWTAHVDSSAYGGAPTLVYGYGAPADTVFLIWGELLLDPFSPNLFLSVPSTPPSGHANAVPADIAYLGGVVFSQAVLVTAPPQLTNAVDLILGY